MSDEYDSARISRAMWKIFAAMFAAVAAVATRKGSEALWKKLGSSEVPNDPNDPAITWSQAIGWALLAGSAAGLARVIGRRGAAAAWKQVTGNEAPAA